MSALILLITISLRLLSAIAFNDVISIDISTATRKEAATSNTLQITLWFNHTIYQHSLASPTNDHTYTITTFTNLGPSDCHKSPSNTADAKIMIENNAADAVLIDSIAFYTTSGTWYGINARCFDDALYAVQGWMNFEPYSSTYVKDDLECAPYTKNVILCIDNEINDCEPAKQIFYFDTMRPNEFIANASWSDATNITPEIVSCDPSKTPTNNPTFTTIKPTNSPSQDPTSNPSKHPTFVPSTDPTSNPSKDPSADPTAKLSELQVLGTVEMIHETADATENATSEKKEFLMDSLTAILIAIGGSLFILITIMLIIGVMWKKKESKRLKQDQTILERDDVKIAETQKENKAGDISDSEQLYVKYDDPETNTKGTKQAEEKEEEEKSDEDDAEKLCDHEGIKRVAEIIKETARSVHRGTNEVELTATHQQTKQNEIGLMRNVDEKSQNIIALETVTNNGRNTNNSVSDQSDYGENDDREESSTFSVSNKEEHSVKEGTTKTGEEIKIKLPQSNKTKGE